MMSQRSGKDEPWTYAEGPPCLDSIVAASSIAPEERATFTVWADETSWHNPARDGKVEVKSVDGSSVARTQRNARRRMFAMLILAALGIAALVLLVLGFSKKSATQSQSTAPPASSSTSLNQPMPTAAVATTTAPPAGILDTPGALIFINKCTTEFDVYYTINMPHDMSEVSQRALNSSTLAMVVPGANWTDYIAADFRLGNSTAATIFAANRNNDNIYYTVSTGSGFNVPILAEPVHALRIGCPAILCTYRGCERNRTLAENCSWVEPLQITFCP
ncbi:hypothetical protein Ae201684_000371 [Aphanomyces euteiches]|uniref:Uncharacterized protein n=1 Tax=Aphanomyces euteiches TaxID=100861 RepID=A0A6G0XXZ5_9STRA|nr:hypothetical protein Ae201684_000371 [Aphanomyces euteiches]KAH9135517.1 hypothetical protein AeRB84_019105 [Aphanomyces euteiches]